MIFRQKKIIAAAVILLAAVVSCTSPYADDPYLRGLKIREQTLSPVDSSDLDVYGYWQPRDVVNTYDGWFVISSSDNDYHLLFVNPVSGEHFYAIRRGRGPGEIVSGADLHKSGNAIRYYDFTFDKGGFAAFVMLSGITVNAGIYLVSSWLRDGARKSVRAYVRAFDRKIWPISLTIISTILGLVPFLFDGPSEVFWFAFAVGTISGLLFSVIALLLFLPAFLWRTPRRTKKRRP